MNKENVIHTERHTHTQKIDYSGLERESLPFATIHVKSEAII